MVNTPSWPTITLFEIKSLMDTFSIEIKYKSASCLDNIQFQILLRTDDKKSFFWWKLPFTEDHTEDEAMVIHSKYFKSVNNAIFSKVKSLELRGKKLGQADDCKLEIIDISLFFKN